MLSYWNETLRNISRDQRKDKFAFIINKKRFEVPLSYALAISSLVSEKYLKDPTFHELEIEDNEKIEDEFSNFIGGKEIREKIFIKLGIILKNIEMLKKWKNSKRLSKETVIEYIRSLHEFEEYNSEEKRTKEEGFIEYENIQEEIEFIVKHLEEMKEAIKEMKAEELIYIIRNEGITLENEDTLWEIIKNRIREMKTEIYKKGNNQEAIERNRKMRRLLLENIQIKNLNPDNFKEYIEEVEPEDISCSSTINSTEGKNIWKQIQEMILDENNIINNSNNIKSGKVVDFQYTGGEQTFIPILPGRYKLEVWGAQGGGSYGGKGAYASGVINFNKNQTVKVYVGGQGSPNSKSSIGAGGYNGGGNAAANGNSNQTDSYGGYRTFYGGGGASDIRVGGTNLQNRVIVAGGGGGGGKDTGRNNQFYYPSSDGRTNSKGSQLGGPYGGFAGGLGDAGHGCYWCCGGPGSGATTSRGGYGGGTNWSNSTVKGGDGSLGLGGSGSTSTYEGGAGGGGGYYGGGGGAGGCGCSTGGGGSSYVGGVSESTVKAGNELFNSPSGTSETGHSGNGHIRITYLGK